MDKKKQDNKTLRQGSSRLASAEQQAQLAFAQQLGIPPEFLGASLQGYGAASGIDAQRLLNPMAAAGGYPFMNPAALQGFAGLGSLSGHSSTGEAEWWNMAQNQALAASLAAGFYPGSMGFPMLQADSSQKSKPSTHNNLMKGKDENRKSFESNRMSPRPGSSGMSTSRSHQERVKSIESVNSSSKERPESHHSSSSPYTESKQSTSNAKSWLDGLSAQQQQKLNEQVLQSEMMRQLEQQFLVHQFQLQQQQQQDQLTAALQSVMTGSVGNLPGSSSSNPHKKGSSDAEKLQQQMAMMMQQMMQAGGGGASSMQGISPSMAASLFSTPGALETMMAMSQFRDMNPYSSLGNSKSHRQEDSNSEHRDTNLPLSSYSHSSSLHNSSKSQKNFLSASPSSSRNIIQSSPRKSHQSSPLSVAKNAVYPPISGIPGAEMTPDNILLAAIQSQQLQQYEALIKQELEAVNRLHDQNTKSTSGESSKSKVQGKRELSRNFELKDDTSSSLHNRTNLYSPANSTSSRGKSHTSPNREYSSSPSRKQLDAERSQSRGCSSSKHLSPSVSKHGTKNHSINNENLNDPLKMLSNPNLSQQDLAAMLGFPATANPAALLAGMAPYHFPANSGLLDAAQSTSRMTSEQLEKLNKDLAAALALETHKLQEQLRQQQLQMDNQKRGKDKDNHVSVIHQNNKNFDESNHQSSSKDSLKKVLGKRTSDSSKLEERKIGNGDAASSDGDVNSEASGDKNNLLAGKQVRKRRRVITNEDEILEPLKHDWKREVRFKFVGSQLRGEVIYISPTGKKFRTYPDIIKHLEENKMSHLHRNNFSFSSRLRIGNFYEQKEKGDRQWVKMTEEELDQRMQHLDRGQTPSPFPENCDQMSDSSSSKGDAKSAKKEREQEKQKEQLKILRQQEKMQKLEQQRIEREIRERLALEELERQRMAEALEREQRRQQMILMRALETRKRVEERERRREELRIEKIVQREKKMEQRRIAMQIARELKMPVEDMKTIGAPELPDLTRLQGTYDNKCPHQLSGNACADVLMVLEFVKTFKECMRIEDTIIPSFEQLQLGLLNDPKHTPALTQITMSLLHQCLCDPGVPAPGPWLHCLTGVKVTDIDVGDANYSEILRLFIWARSGYKTEIAVRLETLPFLSLTTDEKAQSLAFLVNELVCSRPICMEIEKNLDMLATLRRDKWIVEGQMRQLRVAHEKNPIIDSPVIKLEDEENSNSSMSFRKDLGKPGSTAGDLIKDEPQEETSLFQRKMEELTQQHNSYNSQLARSSKPLRAIDIGQDRYKRRYWVLPNLGGVYVEGLESGISYEDDEESPDEDEDEEEDEVQQHPMDNKTRILTELSDSNVKNEEQTVTPCENKYLDPQNEMTEMQSQIAKETTDDTEMIVEQSLSSEANTTVPNMETTPANGASNNVIADPQSSTTGNDVVNPSFIEFPASDLDMKSLCCNPSVSNGNSLNGNFPLKLDNETLVSSNNQERERETKTTLETFHASKETEIYDETDNFNKLDNVDISNDRSDEIDDDTTSLDEVDTSEISKNHDDDSAASPIASSPTCKPEPRIDAEICKSQTEKAKNDDTIFQENLTESDQRDSSVMSVSSTSSQQKNPPVLSVTSNQQVLKVRSSNDMDKDSVLAAAKAIAAKAVASSSHLLFPKNETAIKPKLKTPRPSTRDKDKKSISDGSTGLFPIGEHTINTLVQMGVNPTSLTSQQLDALRSRLDNQSSNEISDAVSQSPIELTKENDKESSNQENANSGVIEGSLVKTVDSESRRKESSDDQDIPMDLSCPQNSLNNEDSCINNNKNPTCASNKIFPIKIEQGMAPLLCESPGRDESDSKSFDNKYFVPISVADNVKSEPNQIMASCPSPNTLANYIMASVNHCQLPALDDIKFPIRAPDVKEESDTIPRDRKRGWWRIESEAELRRLSEKLHLRGIREKQLHRSITKNFEICTNSMADSTLPAHQFAVLTKSKTNSITKSNNDNELKGSEEDIPSRFLVAEKLAFEAEMRVLQQVENLAIRCVDMSVVPAQWRIDNPKPSMCRKDLAHVPLGPLRDKIGSEIKFDALNPIQHDPSSALGAAVNLLGCLERSVYRRYLKPPLVRKGGASEFSSLPSLSESGAMDVAHGLRIWRNAVASSSSASQLSLCIKQLDACIAWDRSTTLSPVKNDISVSTKVKKRKPEKRTAPKTKIRSVSPSQPKKRRRKKLNPAKAVSSLENAEDKLLKHSRMPIDTADVISKSVLSEDSNPIPIINGDIAVETDSLSHIGDSTSAILTNSNCSVTAAAQFVGDFVQTNGQHFNENLSPQTAEYHTTSDNVSEEYKPASDSKKKKKKKKSKKIKLDLKDDKVKKPSKPRKRADKDTINCRNVLRELQSHEAATWFLFPVDCKLVPGYRKIIKKPIDFHTIESRLKRGRYKSKEDFVSEVRLVFDNCQKFNEDNSNIGRAGHQIREFFEKRWSDVLREKYGETIERSLEDASYSKTDTVQEIESNSVNSESEVIPEYSYHEQDSSEGCLVMDES